MTVKDFIDDLMAKQRSKEFDVLNKYSGSPPCVLRDDSDIMAILVAFGANLDYQLADHKLVISSVNPVGVFWDGFKFHVYENRG